LTISSILQIVSLAGVVLVSNRLTKRKREVDSDGNPTLRLWGNCFIGLMLGIFFLWITLKNLSNPFYQRYPENTAVGAFFCVLGFLCAAWGYFCKITLTRSAITYQYLPFLTRVYPVKSVESVESQAINSAVIRFSDGRKIAVLPLYSGRDHFLETLATFIAGRGA
jgi:hypothetical protein